MPLACHLSYKMVGKEKNAPKCQFVKKSFYCESLKHNCLGNADEYF